MSQDTATMAAFAAAQDIARETAVAKFLRGPLEFGYCDHGSPEIDLDKACEHVREIMVAARIGAGAGLSMDPNGTIFAETLSSDQQDGFWEQCVNRQEAGYMIGLAIGLMMARGA